MIKAIIYSSKTGFTKKYAELLGAEMGLAVYTPNEAENVLRHKDSIIYMGWLCAGKIIGYKKARRRYGIAAVCAVGMTNPETDQLPMMLKLNDVKPYKLFYLQGGFDKTKLKGAYKIVMQMVESNAKQNASGADKEAQRLSALQNGCDCVRAENLAKVLAYLKEKPLTR